MLQKRFFDMKELHNATLFFECEDELVPLMYEAVTPDSEIFLLTGKDGKAYALYIEDFIDTVATLKTNIEDLAGAKIKEFINPKEQKKFKDMAPSEWYENYDLAEKEEWAKHAVEVTPAYFGFLVELKT